MEPPDPHIAGLAPPWLLVTELPSTRETPRRAKQWLPLPHPCQHLVPGPPPPPAQSQKTGEDPGTLSTSH